jgi:hypothetical protein
MNVKAILESGLINTAHLAREIYRPEPGKEKAAAIRLHQKIKQINRQRLTDDDLIAIENYLKNIFK